MSKIKDIAEYQFNGMRFVPKYKHNFMKFIAISMFFIAGALYFGAVDIKYEAAYEVAEEVVEEEIHPAVEYITKTNSKVSKYDAIKIVDSSIKWGNKFGIEPSLILAIAKVESTYDKFAISPVGAFGILQVLPKWHIDKIKAAKVEVGTPEMFDIDANIYVGAQIIKNCKQKYRGDINQSLKCYNGSVGMNTTYAIDVIQAQRNIKYNVSII